MKLIHRSRVIEEILLLDTATNRQTHFNSLYFSGEFPVVSHNHHHRLPKTVRTAASASVVSQCGTRRVRSQSVTPSVKRNPSRLYRVVKPLTEVTPTPSPATKRCVGPEFIVMASEKEEAAANVLMLNNRSKEQNFNNIKQVHF